MYETMHSIAHSFELIVPMEKNQSVEVAISDVSDDGGLQAMLFEILLSLVYELRQLRHGDTISVAQSAISSRSS